MKIKKNSILVIDFGSQYTKLISRRIRELKVFSEIANNKISIGQIKKIAPNGIVLSGGPMSVFDKNSPKINKKVFELGIPVLGICYGQQLICQLFGGKVEKSHQREYGKATLSVLKKSLLFSGLKKNSVVWMSHGDNVTKLPSGFENIGESDSTKFCAIQNKNKNIYAVQFHPEVKHTELGEKIIKNFIFKICKCKPDWTAENFIEKSINQIKNEVGQSKVICALSGGVDSTVAAVLVEKAIGKNLLCLHIDTGLMRKNESWFVINLFKNNLHLNVKKVDASKLFLKRLKNVTDPEKKRKIIGKTFIEVFEKEAKKFGEVKYLVQGTLYPDVIESSSQLNKNSVTIKTHHNVGGLPEKMKMKLIEPFRDLFKDEVRTIGAQLNIPKEFLQRHPFPGPGLAVRIIGSVSKNKLEILRQADEIFINEIIASGYYNKIWQAFAVLLPIQSVGVMGDARTYEFVLALRAITSFDGMTAECFNFNTTFLSNLAGKIINNVKGINRVVYDVSSKPPATIEWE